MEGIFTVPGGMLTIYMILLDMQVNKAGAAMLEYIATYGQPTAPIPAAIVACVPKTMHLEEVGDVSFDITPDAIVNAITVGLNEPLASEPEVHFYL